MHNHKYEDNYFDDDFEVTYTEELPGISLDFDDTGDDYPPQRQDVPSKSSRKKKKNQPLRDASYENYRNAPPKRTPASELASPLRAPMRAGTHLVERVVSAVLRVAPVLMSVWTILLTLFVVWTEYSTYGELDSLFTGQNLTLILYLAVGAILFLWQLCSFFFILGGVWTRSGRGITFFILIYACSYIVSLFANLVPEGLPVLDGIKGGLAMYGSLYPRLFTPCLLGIITCILQKISK